MATAKEPEWKRVLLLFLKASDLPAPEFETRFHQTRQWRFDVSFPALKLALEVEGGLWSKNPRARAAHSMPLAILRDMEKSNAAVVLGWRVLRFTPSQVSSGEFLSVVQSAMDGGPTLSISPPKVEKRLPGTPRTAG